MKKIYAILLATFISVNLFGQTGYKLDPGKLNIYRTLRLPDPELVNYKDIMGVRTSLVTALNLSGHYAVSLRIIGSLSEAIADVSYIPAIGIYGYGKSDEASTGTGGTGVFGLGSSSQYATGVYGQAGGYEQSGTYYGVKGFAGSTGTTATNYAIYGLTYNTNATSFAGYFQGNVHVNGTLSKSAGTFKIDHPLDPLNKYLSHSFVESPDMMNIYNGNITTDQNGRATVNLPDYFEALNMDFRYQLTAIGEFAQVIVKGKIKGNQFVIATDKPNIEVSWQVTGVRNDAYAKQNRVVPEQDKPKQEKGKYLNADAFGLPREQSLHAVKDKELRKVESPPTDKNQEPKKD